MNNVGIAIGWTLIHSLWQAGVAAVVMVALLRVVRSSLARYTIACTALLAVVAAFLTGLVYFFPWGQDDGTRFAFRVGDPREFAIPLGSGASIKFSVERALSWLAPIWLIGVAIFNIRHLVHWFATCRLRTRGVCAAPDRWQDRLYQAAARLGVSKSVTLLESCFVQVPVVIGQMRPVILFPIGLLAGLPADQVELILMHELAHIRRWDYGVNMLQTFIEGLMFYNPAVWWISKVIRTEREHCCDDIVVVATQNAHAYAAALAALEETRSGLVELALASTGGSLVKRIHRLLRPSTVPGFAWTSLVSAVIVIAGTAALFVARPIQPLPAPISMSAGQSSTALQRWVSEDVAYIITNEERVAFNSLQTDEERAQFIIQFWQRRDPTPGTVENEFREEHYRRIAEANRKFTTAAGVLGWKTDRGRALIMWGKPDEIESHPSGGQYARPGGGNVTTFPFEIWRYAYLQGIGRDVLLEFVDPASTGEFRLSVDPNEKNRLLLQK